MSKQRRVPAVRCSATAKSTGKKCKSWAIPGGTVCPRHGGGAKQVKAKAAIRAEVFAWGLDDEFVDPGETLMKLLAQSRRRVALYASLLEQAYEAAERLRSAYEAEELIETDNEEVAEKAKDDLRRIFNVGGVASLIGFKYSASKDFGLYATSEAIRGLVDLESKEREFCANLAVKALAAGIEERKVRLEEGQLELAADLIEAVLGSAAVGLTAKQRQEALVIIDTKLAEASALPEATPTSG